MVVPGGRQPPRYFLEYMTGICRFVVSTPVMRLIVGSAIHRRGRSPTRYEEQSVSGVMGPGVASAPPVPLRVQIQESPSAPRLGVYAFSSDFAQYILHALSLTDEPHLVSMLAAAFPDEDDTETAVPDEEVAVPDEDAAVLDNDAAVPDDDAANMDDDDEVFV